MNSSITSKPSTIVFDLGKVLVDFDYGLSAAKLARTARLTATEIKDLIDHSPLLFDYEKGWLTSQEFHEAVQNETGYSGNFQEFSQVFADIFSPMDEMIAVHQALREKGYPTFIFSNTNEIAIGHIRNRFPFFSNFDGYVYSYEHGCMKPDAPLYEQVESVTGHKGKDILYLDDRPENVEAGKNRGWQVIHQTDSILTRNVLTQAGLI